MKLTASLALVLFAGIQDASLPELLERGIFTEETMGDLDQAIEIYLQIVEEGRTNRAFVARAQYRLSACYAKQGRRDDAVSTLRRLVAEYPEQDELVAQAQERLVELGAALPEAGAVLRRVWADADDGLGSPSPDGRYLSYTDWSTGDLALHDLTTGEGRRLTGKDGWSTSEFAEQSVISPDGVSIAYAWFLEPNYELRIVGVDASEPRVAYHHDDCTWLMPLAWAPDGSTVLVYAVFVDRPGELLLVPSTGGEPRTLRSVPRLQGGASFAPNGRWVVYSRPTEGLEGDIDVFVLSVASGEERPLVQHPAEDLLLGWVPGGEHVLFASDRRDTWDAWAVRVSAGEPVGEAALVKSNLGDVRLVGDVYPMGFSADGTLFLAISLEMLGVHLAAFDPVAGRISGSPTRLVEHVTSKSAGPDWSRDGKQIAYLSLRSGSHVITILSTDGEEIRQVTVAPELERIWHDRGVRWAPDGNAFLVTGRSWGEQSFFALFSIDAHTGAVTTLYRLDPDGGALRHAQWSPDGKTVYFERRGAEEETGLFALELETGRTRLVRAGPTGKVALSPDGSWLAFTADRHVGAQGTPEAVSIAPVAGGTGRVLWTAPEGETLDPKAPLAWTRDGEHVLFGRRLATGPGAQATATSLWRVAVAPAAPDATGVPEPLGLEMPWLGHLRVHPDGDSIAFDAGQKRLEIWALENFLPGDGR